MTNSLTLTSVGVLAQNIVGYLYETKREVHTSHSEQSPYRKKLSQQHSSSITLTSGRNTPYLKNPNHDIRNSTTPLSQQVL